MAGGRRVAPLRPDDIRVRQTSHAATGQLLGRSCTYIRGLVAKVRVTESRPLNQLLRIAVIAGVENAVRVHIGRGDNLNARDAGGMTPLMLAAVKNKPAICKLLLSAGADHSLLDPSGKTALDMALAAGSSDATAILRGIPVSPGQPLAPNPEAVPAPFIDASPVDLRFSPEAATCAEQVPPAGVVVVDLHDTAPERQFFAQSPLAVELDDQPEFDLSGWESEEERAPPEADLALLGAASAIQGAITSHQPIDSSVEWDDIDAYLPEQALPLARADDSEGRAVLRRLLLRAIREGSVPSLDVEAFSTNNDRSPNPEAEVILVRVVNDLGAEVDERFEYADASDSFDVFVDPEESPDEEAALDEALGTIDGAASPRHEPLRIYQREFQRLRLLTAEEEVELAQSIEAAVDAALDALASWPDGIERTLAAGAEVMAGSRPLSSMWLGDAEPDLQEASAESLDAHTSGADLSGEPMDDDGEPVGGAAPEAENAGFAEALSRLGAMTDRGRPKQPASRDIRDALAALRLNRRFLLELGRATDASARCASFECALTTFQKARDRMTAANLKLAFFHARKYLRSGEPLDDLAQEANIGLLKAVDRYEWRRGHRFSTYATWWIRQQIGRYVANKARTIRIPAHLHEKTLRLERETEAFERVFGREPTVEELASRLQMPRAKVGALLRVAPEPSPLHELRVDEMVAIDSRDAFAEPDPADVVESAELRAFVESLVSSLPIKDGRILRLRFGIGVDDVLTLDEIGQRYAVTRERIRQIEARALKKLRHRVWADASACLALGVEPPPMRSGASSQGSDIAEDSETVDQAEQSIEQQESSHHRTLRTPSESARCSKPSAPSIGISSEPPNFTSWLWTNDQVPRPAAG